MTKTGWLAEEPDEAPAMPLTAQLLANRQPWDVGDGLALARAHSALSPREERTEPDPEPLDPDEVAAKLIIQGYMPGTTQALSQRLGDVLAELADEHEKISRAERRREHFAREQAAGRLSGFAIMRMDDDGDGDAVRAEKLERRADSLRRQLADAGAKLAPQREEAPADGVEAASRHAHSVFAEVTRAKMAEVEAGRPVSRPKDAGYAVRAEEQPVDCPQCQHVGADWEESVMIHKQADMDDVDLPQRAEARRLMKLGYSQDTAEWATAPDARRAMIEQ